MNGFQNDFKREDEQKAKMIEDMSQTITLLYKDISSKSTLLRQMNDQIQKAEGDHQQILSDFRDSEENQHQFINNLIAKHSSSQAQSEITNIGLNKVTILCHYR